MNRPTGRAQLYVFWCWLYIVLGLCSLAAGIFLLVVGHRYGGPKGDSGLTVIALILVLFGLLRIGNAIYVLRNIYRRAAQQK